MNIVRLSCIHFCQLFVCTNRAVFITVCVFHKCFDSVYVFIWFLQINFNFCCSLLVAAPLLFVSNQFVNVSAVVLFSLFLSVFSVLLACLRICGVKRVIEQQPHRTVATEQSAKRHNWFNFIIKYHAIYELHINI